MAKQKPNKTIRFLRGEIKWLEAEVKRLKRNQHTGGDFDELDKDEIEYPEQHDAIPCMHCKPGTMIKTLIIGKEYWRCDQCRKTKKI